VSLRKAVECVKKNNNFIITTHTNPEGDALGAALGFLFLLKKLGKNASIISEDEVPLSYKFLPGSENIRKLKYSPKKRISFGCLVFIDCSDERRTGEVYRINTENKPVLNIDHHISNERFADVNWIEPLASSCAEMVYRLYKKFRVPFDRDAAICLYAGMLSDTGSFRYSNTKSATHKAVSELLKFDLDTVQIYKNIYEDIPFEDMKLLSKILPRMRRQEKGKIIWFQIEQKMLKDKKLSFDLTEHVLSFARSIKGAEVCALFKENLGVKDEIRINLRSQGKVDVNKIAAHFGGGGHRTASGATVHGKINQVRKRVLARIKESLK
jgi:phosphoesterase RecJ-like protein